MSTQNAGRSCLAHDGVIDRPFDVKRMPPRPGRPGWLAAAAGVLVLSGWALSLRAETIPVPNASFESPVTTYVDTRIDSWQKTPKPFWYDESGGFLWGQLTGLFKNTEPGKPDHIDNCDGSQAIFLFAVPEVGLFQDYDSTDWANATPTHAFDAKFEVGKSCDLTVGVIGGGMGMVSNVTLQISLYYRDGASNRVTVAATSVTNTPTVFSNTTHLVDFQVRVPAVKAGDAWAGQNIGVQLLSTVDPALAGGFWDVDNIRLTSIREPILRGAALTSGQFGFTLESEPGLRFEILASTDLALPLAHWTSLGTVPNVTGNVPFTDPATASPRRFYRARELP
jgi:hypothetical protein